MATTNEFLYKRIGSNAQDNYVLTDANIYLMRIIYEGSAVESEIE